MLNYSGGYAIGYQSSGSHSDAILFADYCVDVLGFDYFDGAIFNTYESYNGYTFDIDLLGMNEPPSWGLRQGHTFDEHLPTEWVHYQGLVADFIHAGGTGGIGQVFEPLTSTISDGEHVFPAYAMGYSLVEAFYMGLPYIACRNVIVGDPLTTIAWGKQTLTEEMTWSGTNLVTGEINIPGYYRLTLENNAIVNFRHNGFITGNGLVELEGAFEMNAIGWNKSLIKSVAANDKVKIFWSENKNFQEVYNYKIYRKKETENFIQIA